MEIVWRTIYCNACFARMVGHTEYRDRDRGSTSSDASRLIHEIYPFFTI